MAQPSYAIEYIGAVEAKAGVPITSADLLAMYGTATVLKMKTKGVSVSVNNSPLFEVTYDDESYLVTGHTYKFNKDCIVAVGVYKVVT